MKKVQSPLSTGGAPWTNDLLLLSQDQQYLVTQGIMSQFDNDTEGCIVKGGIISGAGPYAITAGVVYINGEFMSFPAVASFTFPAFIGPDTVATVNDTFGDSSSNPVTIEKPAKVLSATPGSGQYVTLYVTGSLLTVKSLKNKYGTTSWASLTLLNSWAVVAAATPQWRLNNGFLEFRGSIDAAASTNAQFATVTTFPSLVTAVTSTIASAPVMSSSSIDRLSVHTSSGAISISVGYATGKTYVLDNCRLAVNFAF